VKRKKCKICRKTFRHYPEGVGRASQTKTLKGISVTLYVLGLSYDNVSSFLDALDCGIVKATVWNNLQEAGEEALSLREKLEKEKVRIVGIDTTAFKVAGGKLTVAFLTDLIGGKPIEIEMIESTKARILKRRFQKLLQDLGADDLIRDVKSLRELVKNLPEGLEEKLKTLHLRYSFAQPLKGKKRQIYSIGCACSP